MEIRGKTYHSLQFSETKLFSKSIRIGQPELKYINVPLTLDAWIGISIKFHLIINYQRIIALKSDENQGNDHQR